MTQSFDSAQPQSSDHVLALSAMDSLSLGVTSAPQAGNTSLPAGPCPDPPRVYLSTRPGDEQDYPNCCQHHQASFGRYIQSIEADRTTSSSAVVIHAYDAYTRLLSTGGSLRSAASDARPFSAGTFTLPDSDLPQANSPDHNSTRSPSSSSPSATAGGGSTPLPLYVVMPSPSPTYNSIDHNAPVLDTSAFPVAASAPPFVAHVTPHVVPAPPPAVMAVAAILPVSTSPVTSSAAVLPPAAVGATFRARTNIPAHLRWYVVTRGTKVGVHRGWHIVSPLVIGVRTSSYAGFDTRDEAMQIWQESVDANVVTQL